MREDVIEVVNARVHNLKNVSVKIPRKKLVVITGLSGSGKSSLAFDTIYAEGRRRYMETFSAYIRQFLGGLERPDVDQISGLSPVIAIEQKTISKNPRSTVGTITEVYDFLRLLYARAGDAYSYNTGELMQRYTTDQVVSMIMDKYKGKKILLLAPLVKGRKGHYKELFNQIIKQGFSKVRIDGELQKVMVGMQLDRYKIHDVEVVIDQLVVQESDQDRISGSVKLALKHGKGVVQVYDVDAENFQLLSKHLMCPTSGIAYQDPEPNLFSFNSPYGACSSCNGLGEISEIAMEKVIPEPTISIRKGGIAPLGEYKKNSVFKQVELLGKQMGYSLDDAVSKLTSDQLQVILYGTKEAMVVRDEVAGTYQEYKIDFEGVVPLLLEQVNEGKSKTQTRWASGFMNKKLCPICEGSRLKKEANFFMIDQKSIGEVASLNIQEVFEWSQGLLERLSKKQRLIGEEVLKEINARLSFLLEVGLGYLTLNRTAKTLSGGEAQRIRLATQIGSQLMNVLYILDEPSIGLHQRDNTRLIKSLQSLRDIGNSVIVVEHDKEIMLASDYLIDIGPESGVNGGEVVAADIPKAFFEKKGVTASYLSGKVGIELPKQRRENFERYIRLFGASGNNLKNVDLHIPLGMLVCVTGVSGSGKSSLINHTLYPILNQHIYNGVKKPLPYDRIEGLEHVDKVISVNQSPIGRTPRSNPATYTGIFTDIRALFASMPESKIRGYKQGRFSFNVRGGRCEECQGAGLQTIEMNFLPDVYVQCNMCRGKRYNAETLKVKYRGKSISEVLDMTVEQAVGFFEHIPSIHQKIQAIYDVGLGYVKLGQPSTTLSGGEAQRVKLASELSKKQTGKTFYLMDEPSTGLHFQDIRVLMNVIQKLVDHGNTVLIIEHNLDIIKLADYIIDIGPEGGDGGGYVVCEGSPEEVAKNKQSYTSKYLKEELSI